MELFFTRPPLHSGPGRKKGFAYECSGTPLDASGVRCVMSRSGLKGGCEGESDFVNGGFCPTDKRGLDTEMRNKKFLTRFSVFK